MLSVSPYRRLQSSFPATFCIAFKSLILAADVVHSNITMLEVSCSIINSSLGL
ncbi:unnamed protein product [Meloidogyne enterolobii]|uniref:Uncharacterized protein n=1 Tax=Meloidogyne enterolobii TaxID=390850 RepID=A0ACB0XU27_MELEN